MKYVTSILFLIVYCGPPCYAQLRIDPDTNRNGSIDDDEIEAYERAHREHWARVRSTAPNSKLVPGFYVNIREALSEALMSTYIHAFNGKYVYFQSDLNWQSMDFGKSVVSDGWLRTKRTSPFERDVYWHPHQMGGRDMLLSEQAWETWLKTKRLDPYGVLVRIDRELLGQAIDVLPLAAQVFNQDNLDKLGEHTFILRPRDVKVAEPCDEPNSR